MAGLTAPSIPTNCASLTAITERNAEHEALGENATPFSDIPGDGTYDDPYLGLNRAGGNSPGIGINTGEVYQTAQEIIDDGPIFTGWTELDQDGAARIPQDSQLLGGINEAAPADGGVFTPAVIPITMTEGADINDTANFVITDTAAVDGAIMDTSSGAINDTGETVGVGDLVWGKVPVA